MDGKYVFVNQSDWKMDLDKFSTLAENHLACKGLDFLIKNDVGHMIIIKIWLMD